MSCCRSCGAPIRWAATQAGRIMPIDPAPSPKGNLAVRELESGDLIVSVLRARDQQPARQRANAYLSHFASCPSADQHRDAAKKGGGAA